ncbi:hypothetical protein [Streptomyces sp. NBC_00271]|nr:hypothetical protein [Streptomyces sp. NBC_00271]
MNEMSVISAAEQVLAGQHDAELPELTDEGIDYAVTMDHTTPNSYTSKIC